MCVKLEEKKRKEKSGGKGAAWKFWRGKLEEDLPTQPQNIPADDYPPTDRYSHHKYNTDTYSSRSHISTSLVPSKFNVRTDGSLPKEGTPKVVVPCPTVIDSGDLIHNKIAKDIVKRKLSKFEFKARNLSQENLLQEKQVTGSTTTGNSAGNLSQEESKQESEKGTNRKIEVTGNGSQENMTGRKIPTPVANRKLHRIFESPFTSPKRRLQTPGNLSTGKRRRKGGIEKKKKF